MQLVGRESRRRRDVLKGIKRTEDFYLTIKYIYPALFHPFTISKDRPMFQKRGYQFRPQLLPDGLGRTSAPVKYPARQREVTPMSS